MSEKQVLSGIWNEVVEEVKKGLEGLSDFSFLNESVNRHSIPILEAIRYDKKGDIVKLLLEKGADPYVVDRDMMNGIQMTRFNDSLKDLLRFEEHEELIEAVHKKDLDKVKQFIGNGLSVHTRTMTGYTLLMLACRNKNVEMAKFLLENGAYPNDHDIEGVTALMETFNYDYSIELADLLVEHGANVHMLSKNHGNVSSFASNHNLEALTWCFDHNVDIHILGNYQFSNLTKAARSADYKTVVFLLEKGLDPNHKDQFEKTPLHWAAERSLKMVQAMMKHGADPTRVDRFKNTPKDCAKRENKESIVNYLEKKIIF